MSIPLFGYALACLFAVGVSLPAGAQSSRPIERAEPRSPLRVSTVEIARGLRHPWGLAFLPDGAFLITEKDGGLKRVEITGEAVSIEGLPADLDNVRQNARDNSGLFDVALHPAFAVTRFIYLTYASKDGAGTTTKLIRARLDGNRLNGIRTLFEATPRSADRFHYGGGLLVTREHVYLTVGERHYNERDNPPLPVAQDRQDRRGKIYRFDLDGRPAHGNPDFGAGAPPGLYALGIRAAQGLAWEPGSGRIWFSEHGSIGGDEVNILAAGANYGWPVRTSGTYRNAEYRPPAIAGTFAEPAWTWTDRTVAPTGVTFYTGASFPEWQGDLLVAGLSRGYLVRLDIEDGKVRAAEYLLEHAPVRLRNVKQGPDGSIYLLTDQPDGRLLRVERAR
jgi:aldose sugar dehydrogenase